MSDNAYAKRKLKLLTSVSRNMISTGEIALDPSLCYLGNPLLFKFGHCPLQNACGYKLCKRDVIIVCGCFCLFSVSWWNFTIISAVKKGLEHILRTRELIQNEASVQRKLALSKQMMEARE